MYQIWTLAPRYWANAHDRQQAEKSGTLTMVNVERSRPNTAAQALAGVCPSLLGQIGLPANRTDGQTRAQAMRQQHIHDKITQNVFELPSTAMLAPCAMVSELLALIAPCGCK